MSAADGEGFAIDPTVVRAWKRYPAYKDSGVEWLGEVPAGWDVQKLKFTARIKLSSVDKKSEDNEEDVRLCNYTDVYYNDRITEDLKFMKATASPEEIASFTLRQGDVLITKDSEDWNDIAVPAHVDEDLDGVLCGYHLAQIRPDQKAADSKYLFWSFNARGVNHQFQIAANGITRYGVGKYWIDNSSFLVPSLPEQHAIAAFLDRETARLDALIEKKQRFIELLEEKRQALISHAVTKGLDPDAAMKDSGVEWVGEVPVHWAIKRLKTISPRISGRLVYSPAQYFCENGVPFLFGTNVTEEGISLKDTKFIPHEVNERFKHHALREGDLVMVRVGAPGLTTVVPTEADGLNCASMMIIRRDLSFNSRWLAFALNSRIGKTQVDITTYGAAQVQINISDAVNFMIPTPPLDEQNRIVDKLDQRIFKISSIVSLINTNVERLQEYRTALISAAIIGKIDVRSKTEAT
ncbi:MAG: restriction endonuclease subunit S [Methanoculleus sp.]|nr:restriction endonuclease subunit S [Methanoculleus sp.]